MIATNSTVCDLILLFTLRGNGSATVVALHRANKFISDSWTSYGRGFEIAASEFQK
jgi:hypothetical protein